MVKNTRKAMSLGLACLMVLTVTAGFLSSSSQAEAATFSKYSIRPSRISTGTAGVNFLVKLAPVTTATEASIDVTFGSVGSYTLAAAASITTSTAGLTNWDAACTNAVPGLGATAASVAGQTANFVATDMTVGTTYCFLITAGITNPAAAGNYSIVTTTKTSVPAAIDTASMRLPIVSNDSITVTASVNPFVRCNVTTTVGGDNASNLGALEYGTVSSSADDIQIQGGTNATGGMVWYYRNAGPNNGLYSTTGAYNLAGATAESTISATTATCAGGTPCFGIYYTGTNTHNTGTFVGDTAFTGGTITTDVGPMTTNTYGSAIGNSNSTVASQVTANYHINATAGEDSPVAADYSATLIFTCKADL